MNNTVKALIVVAVVAAAMAIQLSIPSKAHAQIQTCQWPNHCAKVNVNAAPKAKPVAHTAAKGTPKLGNARARSQDRVLADRHG